MKKTFILICAFLFMALLSLRSQDIIKPEKLNVKWDLNALGDAHIEAGMTMDAAQWDTYKRMLGNNPDLLKRRMERTFPGYFLQNFSYKEDVMNRSYTLSFDALGLSKVNPRGLWQVDLNSKNPDVTKLGDRNYVLTSNYATQGALMQEVDNISFPVSATDIKQDKDAFGKAVFTYSSSSSTGAGGWISLGLGVLLLLIGAVLFLRAKPATVHK